MGLLNKYCEKHKYTYDICLGCLFCIEKNNALCNEKELSEVKDGKI